MLNVDGRIHIGMRAVATDDAAKRLLVGSVGSVYIMAHAAYHGLCALVLPKKKKGCDAY